MSSITPAAGRRLGLLDLSVDLIVDIMEKFPDPRDVCELALSCKALFTILKKYENVICQKIFINSHDPSLFRLARANYAAALLPTCRRSIPSPLNMWKFCDKYLDRKKNPLEMNRNEFTLKRAIYMEDFHDTVRTYAKRFADDFLKTWHVLPQTMPNTQGYQVPATEAECVRIMKALYLAELVSKIAPAVPWRRALRGASSYSDRPFEIFWLYFTPWDSQGVCFVQEWINELMEKNGRNLLDNDERLEYHLEFPRTNMFLFQGLERVLAGDWKTVEDEQQWECIRSESYGNPRFWFQDSWVDEEDDQPPIWTNTMAGTDALKRYEVHDDDKGEASAWYWWRSVHDPNFRSNVHIEEECMFLDEIVDENGARGLTHCTFWDRERLETALGMRIPPLKAMTRFGENANVLLELYDES